MWEQLSQISCMTFFAESVQQCGWNGTGSGKVEITLPDDNTIIFTESGYWTSHGDDRTIKPIRVSNKYLWKLEKNSGSITLGHLRYGDHRPVNLVQLDSKPDCPTYWKAKYPHLCNQDSYQLELYLQRAHIDMIWTISGPNKAQKLLYKYC